MRKLLFGIVAAGLIASPALAELPVGSKAPDFTTTGALAGKPFKFHLADQLKHGPLVLYFFPKAFTSGCTAEAHAFSEAAAAAILAWSRVGSTRCACATFARARAIVPCICAIARGITPLTSAMVAPAFSRLC